MSEEPNQHQFSYDPEAIEYRDVPGFPGYRVGSDGSVWSCRSKRPGPYRQGWFSVLTDNWHLLRATTNPRGYSVLTLRRDGKKFTFRVHQLVLTTFVGPCPDGMEACHFPDRNKSNNALANLRWDTKRANAADKRAHGTFPSGEGNGNHRLTEADVIQAREEHRSGGASYAALGRRFGITDSAMRKAIVGHRWGHIANDAG